MQEKKFNLITVIVVGIFTGIFGFFGGLQYQKSQNGTSPSAQFAGTNAQPENAQGGNGGSGTTTSGTRPTSGANAQGKRPISGEIVSIDKDSITVKTQDGSSKIVIYSTQTKVNKTTEAAVSELKTGTQINVIGSEGTDGTVTAQTIAIGTGLFPGVSGGGQPPGQPGEQTTNK
ncbi:hypothetical protein HGA88_01905 [Candidatus Roizmanbacteria bacterium]|nr:hypothetical protein [Candidatus Roizmanbacteria bacterium]